MKIAFLIIATNKYTEFLEPLRNSIIKHVKIPDATIETVCFTNKATSPRVIPTDHAYHIDHLPWPLITLLRYHTFVRYQEELSKYDYLYYIDADMQVVGDIGSEILGELTVVKHPGFYYLPYTHFPIEKRKELLCNLEGRLNEGSIYPIGAMNGGKTSRFLEMSRVLSENISKDLYSNNIPIWHDESNLCHYINTQINKSDLTILNPGYCYPESWNLPFTKKIIAKDKNQLQIRL